MVLTVLLVHTPMNSLTVLLVYTPMNGLTVFCHHSYNPTNHLFTFVYLVFSIVKMFATHRDDKRRVEKALESINIQSGKVYTLLHVY